MTPKVSWLFLDHLLRTHLREKDNSKFQDDRQRSGIQHPGCPQEEDEGHQGGVREVQGRLRRSPAKVASRNHEEGGSKIDRHSFFAEKKTVQLFVVVAKKQNR